MESAFALGYLTVGRAYSSKFLSSSKRMNFATKSMQKSFNIQDDLKAALIMEITDNRMNLAEYPVKLNQMIDNHYIPLYAYFSGQLMEHEVKHKGKKNRPPLFVGISAPQGCGKTTLTNLMRKLFLLEGKSCVSISLDDFYLTGDEQDKLAAKNSDNPLLQFRGNAENDKENQLFRGVKKGSRVQTTSIRVWVISMPSRKTSVFFCREQISQICCSSFQIEYIPQLSVTEHHLWHVKVLKESLFGRNNSTSM
jgi:tRNA splicing ligase